MKANADIASVRPAPLSNIRSAPGNVRYGSLQERYGAEIRERARDHEAQQAEIASTRLSKDGQTLLRNRLQTGAKELDRVGVDRLIDAEGPGAFANEAEREFMRRRYQNEISRRKKYEGTDGYVFMTRPVANNAPAGSQSGLRVRVAVADADRMKRKGYVEMAREETAGEQAVFGAGTRNAGADGANTQWGAQAKSDGASGVVRDYAGRDVAVGANGRTEGDRRSRVVPTLDEAFDAAGRKIIEDYRKAGLITDRDASTAEKLRATMADPELDPLFGPGGGGLTAARVSQEVSENEARLLATVAGRIGDMSYDPATGPAPAGGVEDNADWWNPVPRREGR